MAQFTFPKDQDNHIPQDAIFESLRRLISGLEDAFLEHDANYRAWVHGEDGWHLYPLLQTGTASAFIKNIDPAADYDAALIIEAFNQVKPPLRETEFENDPSQRSLAP